MGHVYTREVVAVHHGLKLVNWRIGEECGVSTAATAPHDVGRIAVVPFCGFVYHPLALFRSCYVCLDRVKLLKFRVAGVLLVH